MVDQPNNITLDDIRKNPDNLWSTKYLLNSRNFDISWLEEFSDDEFGVDYFSLSINNKFDISWVDRYPDKPWNFSLMHNTKNFKISWVEKYPDKRWSFGCLHTVPDFDFSWLDKFPDKPWDFQELSKLRKFDIDFYQKYPNHKFDIDFKNIHCADKFDISWVDRYPDKPWDFSKLHEANNFHISWVKKYPDKPWNFSKMHLKLEFCELNHDYQEVYNPNFNIYWFLYFPDKPWNMCDIIKNEELLKDSFTPEMLEQLGNFDNEELKKYVFISLHISNCKIFNLYPGLFYQAEQPIELQDLSGHIYYLENWFTQENILAYAKEQLPDLGEFDIAVDAQDGSEELLMASNTDNNTLKNHLFQNRDGPQGMIVYL